MKLFWITGSSGSGKSSVARELQRRRLTAIDVEADDNIFHFIDEQGREPDEWHINDDAWASTYRWSVRPEAVDKLIREYQHEPYLFLCGVAVNQYDFFPLCEKVILLHINETTLINRLTDPTRTHDFGRDPRAQKRLLRELTPLQSRVLKAEAIAIDAKPSLSQVVTAILNACQVQA